MLFLLNQGLWGLPRVLNLQAENAAFLYTVNFTQIWGNDIFILYNVFWNKVLHFPSLGIPVDHSSSSIAGGELISDALC
jgi:hypothetical protein